MRLIIASNNAHKIEEIKAILGNRFDEVLSLREAGITADVVEDGTTFEENAKKKAEEIKTLFDCDAVLSDDSGLAVDALDGAPGVFSARFAGEGHNDAENNEKLLTLMKDVSDAKRSCRFVCAVALARRDKTTLVVRGTVEGTLLRANRGENGFGYDPLFLYGPTGLSFAEMSAEAKNGISHRRNALNALREALERGE